MMNSKNTITVAIVVVVAALVIAIFVFFGGSNSNVSGGLQTVAPLSPQESNALSRDFLQALSSLNSLDLDASFFDDKTFKLLVDYSKDIKDEAVGRDNPFLPVSGDITPVTQSIVIPVPPTLIPPAHASKIIVPLPPVSSSKASTTKAVIVQPTKAATSTKASI